MSCDNDASNESTKKRSQIFEIDEKTSPRINEEIKVCLFTTFANSEEVSDAALLLEQDERSWSPFKDNKSSSCSSLGGHVILVESSESSKRASSLDNVEFVLQSDDGTTIHAASKHPNTRKTFWKNLWFWQRTKNSGSCSSATSHHTDPKLGIHGQKQIRTNWEAGRPLYTTCAVNDIGRRPIERRENERSIIFIPQSCKSDGTGCLYMPLNRCRGTPAAPLYIP